MDQVLLAWLREIRRKLWTHCWLWPIILVIAVFQDRFVGWINEGLDLMGLQLWQSTQDTIRSLGPVGIALILFIATLIFIMIRAYYDAQKVAPASTTTDPPPLRMVGSAENSRISRIGQTDLELFIAVKFENAEPATKIVRRFNAFMVSEGSRLPIQVKGVRSTAPRSGNSRVSMDSGLLVEQGI
jgi:hypothetical protein